MKINDKTITAFAKANGEKFAQADLSRDELAKELGEFFKMNPTKEQVNECRQAWQTGYYNRVLDKSGKAPKDEAVRQAWSRYSRMAKSGASVLPISRVSSKPNGATGKPADTAKQKAAAIGADTATTRTESVKGTQTGRLLQKMEGQLTVLEGLEKSDNMAQALAAFAVSFKELAARVRNA